MKTGNRNGIRHQGNTVCSGFAFVSGGLGSGGLRLVFLAMGVAAAIAFRGIEVRHLRCPNCGRFIPAPGFPWRRPNTAAPAASTFLKAPIWWEKGNRTHL